MITRGCLNSGCKGTHARSCAVAGNPDRWARLLLAALSCLFFERALHVLRVLVKRLADREAGFAHQLLLVARVPVQRLLAQLVFAVDHWQHVTREQLVAVLG